MNNQLQKIITENFKKDFFWEKDAPNTINNIQNNINAFGLKHSNITADIFSSLKNITPNTPIENWTQFFNNDRCIRFLLMINDQEKYVVQVSVLGFFSFYQHPAIINGDEYKYGELKFINKGELALANTVYDSLNNYIAMEWLSRDILTEIVTEFSEIDENPLFSHIVTVADILFTSDYI